MPMRVDVHLPIHQVARSLPPIWIVVIITKNHSIIGRCDLVLSFILILIGFGFVDWTLPSLGSLQPNHIKLALVSDFPLDP